MRGQARAALPPLRLPIPVPPCGGPEPTSPSRDAARAGAATRSAAEITLEWDAFTSDAEPEQQLVIYTAEPGSRSEQALRELAAWAAEHINTAR
jgi:MmyB-like transcription regulator ligand binding domain